MKNKHKKVIPALRTIIESRREQLVDILFEIARIVERR